MFYFAVIGVGRAWYNILPMKAAVDLLGSDDPDQGITMGMLALGLGFAVGTLPAGITNKLTLLF